MFPRYLPQVCFFAMGAIAFAIYYIKWNVLNTELPDIACVIKLTLWKNLDLEEKNIILYSLCYPRVPMYFLKKNSQLIVKLFSQI